jgi:hypothetical protein
MRNWLCLHFRHGAAIFPWQKESEEVDLIKIRDATLYPLFAGPGIALAEPKREYDQLAVRNRRFRVVPTNQSRRCLWFLQEPLCAFYAPKH